MDFLAKLLALAVGALFCLSEVNCGTRRARLSVADPVVNNYFYNNIQGDRGAYSFNYDVSDASSGNTQYRTEERYPNGTVAGAYGYVDAYGAPQRFRYVADQAGYRVYKENYFRPFSGYGTTTIKPIDKIAIATTEPEITWTRPRRPNKKQTNKNTGNPEKNILYIQE